MKTILDKLEAYSMGYELDCRGWCEMPILFYASSTQVTSGLPSQEIFTCKTLLLGVCESCSISDCEIDFSHLVSNESRKLRLKYGVYGKSWCASNDKIDVYNIRNTKEQHLGFVVMKMKICECWWEIYDNKGKSLYTIKQNKVLSCPCSKTDTKYSIEPIEKGNIGGSIVKKWNSCCVNKANPEDCLVTFPKNIEWRCKALIISACIWLYKDQFLKDVCVL